LHADRPWTLHPIKAGGAHQHHDQLFVDLLDNGRPQLVFWNQGAQSPMLSRVPENPKQAEAWPLTVLHKGAAGSKVRYAGGLAADEVDGDGQTDLLAGNTWYQCRPDGSFRAIPNASIGGRIAAGRFAPGPGPQVVIAPGDGVGPLRRYECMGDPADTRSWHGQDVVDRPVVHGHSLQVGDLDSDGHVDIFAAEMAQWSEKAAKPDNPEATARLFFGDGQGHLRTQVLARGLGFHEVQVADLDGDGDLDILNKPYTWQTPRVDVWLYQGQARARK
jgi:hypothetical protein